MPIYTLALILALCSSFFFAAVNQLAVLQLNQEATQ